MNLIKLILFFALLPTFLMNAQVGIGTTNPNASLDIRSSNETTPANTDGMLIPKIDEYPATNPTVSQDGMLVYATGDGSVSKGFYYWDNGAVSWVAFSGASGSSTDKIDDLLDGKSDSDGTNDGSSIFIGLDAGLNDDSSDNRNVGLGFQALFSNTTGFYNTANGYQSLYSNTAGNYNEAVGVFSLNNNISGDNNVAIGRQALYNNDIGNNNISIGSFALNNNADGSNNIAIGYNSLHSNTTKSYNVAVGYNSGFNTNGTRNVFIGYNTGSSVPDTKEGSVFIGAEAGYSENNSNRLYIENSSSSSPLIYGEFDNDLLRVNGDFEVEKTTDVSITAKSPFGNKSSLKLFESGGSGDYGFEFEYDGNPDKFYLWSRTFAGNEGIRMTWLKDGKVGISTTSPSALLDVSSTDPTAPKNTDGMLVPRVDAFPATNPTASQNGMLIFLTTDSTFYFWRNSTTSWISISTSGSQSINDLTDGKSDNDGSQDGSSVFLGVDSGLNDNGTDNRNVGIGFETLKNSTGSSHNSAIGYQALFNNTGLRNNAFGYRSLYSNTTGFSNVAMGHESLLDNTEGLANIAIGFKVLHNNTLGDYNVAIGVNTMRVNTVGNNNIAIGINSLENNTSGSFNVAVGDSSGKGVIGSENVFIGKLAGYNIVTTNIDKSIFIGYQAGLNSGVSNRLYIENSNSTSPLIYGEFDNDLVRVNGNLEVDNTNATISINNLEIGDLGANVLGLDGDIVPYSSVNFDLGNITTTQHWDDVVAVSFIVFSDKNTKNEIETLSLGLQEILQLNPVSFKYNENISANNRTHLGLIAQEVEKIIPQVVITEDVDIDPETGEKIITKGEYLAMNYMELIPVLIKATQEQQTQIEALKKQIAEIKALLKNK